MVKFGPPLVFRRPVKYHETLFRSGDKFDALYLIRAGSFKKFCLDGDGREQITSFEMPGDLLGADGIDSNAYQSDVVALEQGEVCVISFAFIEELAGKSVGLELQLARILSRQAVRDQSLIILLGSMMAGERLATFLFSLSRRLAAAGYSGSDFLLRCTREEIASYLGLSRETISRELARLQAAGTIEVRNEHVRICDIPTLQSFVTMSDLFS